MCKDVSNVCKIIIPSNTNPNTNTMKGYRNLIAYELITLLLEEAAGLLSNDGADKGV